MHETTNCEQITIFGCDQVELKARFWPGGCVAESNPGLLIVHGVCEHGGRYEQLGNLAAAAGFSVLVPDLRGHGLSAGTFVHINRFEDYLEDLQSWISEVGWHQRPLLLVGCSMGGLISIRFCQWSYKQTGESVCDQLFLVSPLLGIKHPIEKWKKSVARLLGHYYPRLKFRSTINPRLLTHDKNVLQQRAKDHLLRRQVTARWFLECDEHRQRAFAEAEAPFPPTTIWQAGADAVVDPLAVKAWADRVKRNADNQVDFLNFPGWYHEIFKEIEGPELQQKFVQMLCKKGLTASSVETAPVPSVPPLLKETD